MEKCNKTTPGKKSSFIKQYDKETGSASSNTHSQPQKNVTLYELDYE